MTRKEILQWAEETVDRIFHGHHKTATIQGWVARDKSGGTIDFVTEEEIAQAYQMIAKYEGILCEPASSASVAGVIKALRLGQIESGKKIVCILTGNGLKDPDSAMKFAASDIIKTSADLSDILKAMKI